ncbi:MAG: M20/M25/M40 family metallo-hydrolase [Chloroflexi bacterium]|nr:M20/M25/M40 family metallo-hydrolase [Chloroflexota bacterium]
MTTSTLSKIDDHIESHFDEAAVELSRLCAQPSVSAQGLGIRECAGLVAEMLKARGFAVEVIPTAGNPIVYAEAPGRSEKTLLFYNHYDVQPPEPLDLWDSPPFELRQRDGALYARGVSDDKGHIVCRLAALDAVKAAEGFATWNSQWKPARSTLTPASADRSFPTRRGGWLGRWLR